VKFSEIVTQTIVWLQREERVSYRALKREFDLNDDTLADLKEELITIKECAVDKDGKMLVWAGAASVPSSEFQVSSPTQFTVPQTPNSELRTSYSPSAERRQLTVMFCDMVGSTALSAQLDPEDLREVVRQYQQTCAEVIQQESLPLLTALLSLPTPSHYPPLTFTPQKQKERTLQALLQMMLAQSERQAMVSVWEDLHWADPSSLEFLSLLIDQLPTSKLLLVFTFRPEFTPPWKPRSHISQLVLNRLGKKQVEVMIEQAAAGKTLPTEVVEQIQLKTDGVPLFVEELTKTVLESVESGGGFGRSVISLGIPATLQEALLARLDRLSTARQVAQLGATLGREFSYELLRAVAPTSETDLQSALAKLVEAEILYQRGVGEQTRYFFKHALIQDTAYQSLLKSTRQQYHQQIAQVLEERFLGTKANHPELLAHHCTEANLIESAIPYWQKAGERATQHSAYVEAISHLTKGLELLKTMPDTPGHPQQELALQLALGTPLMTTKGWSSPEVVQTYTRAYELCQYLRETPQLFPALWGVWVFHYIRADLQKARELGEQLLSLAQHEQDPGQILEAHHALWPVLFHLGEVVAARVHAEQGIIRYDRRQHHSLTFLYGGHDPGVCCRYIAPLVLWLLGYPDQARKINTEGQIVAQELAHPLSLALTLYYASSLYQLCGEIRAVQERVEAVIALSREGGLTVTLAQGTILRGWTLAKQGQREEGILQLRQGQAAYQATGAEVIRTYYLALLAEVYGEIGQAEEELEVLAEAFALVPKTGERFYEAELYRLKGELALQKFQVASFNCSFPQIEKVDTRIKFRFFGIERRRKS
jgi:predicted ATPase